ncbi:MAG TPA: helix-turn-helix transcriptional regulator, partial [Cryptosporangiaceae bacterium]|nr:helix-turn-helix transcriptional regulator [Cryptosporangiaceae bacterium]
LLAAPVIPPGFWDEVVMREAILSRHMGRVIRAWRTHPFHGRQPIPQDRVAAWAGITQAQLSRIENGPPLVHLDRLIEWARLLHLPAERMWFALPGVNWSAGSSTGAVQNWLSDASPDGGSWNLVSTAGEN